jgi:hypothetical protein
MHPTFEFRGRFNAQYFWWPAAMIGQPRSLVNCNRMGTKAMPFFSTRGPVARKPRRSYTATAKDEELTVNPSSLPEAMATDLAACKS